MIPFSAILQSCSLSCSCSCSIFDGGAKKRKKDEYEHENEDEYDREGRREGLPSESFHRFLITPEARALCGNVKLPKENPQVDVAGQGQAGSPGSGGASPYHMHLLGKKIISLPRISRYY
jgi:hypothetical protein